MPPLTPRGGQAVSTPGQGDILRGPRAGSPTMYKSVGVCTVGIGAPPREGAAPLCPARGTRLRDYAEARAQPRGDTDARA